MKISQHMVLAIGRRVMPSSIIMAIYRYQTRQNIYTASVGIMVMCGSLKSRKCSFILEICRKVEPTRIRNTIFSSASNQEIGFWLYYCQSQDEDEGGN